MAVKVEAQRRPIENIVKDRVEVQGWLTHQLPRRARLITFIGQKLPEAASRNDTALHAARLDQASGILAKVDASLVRYDRQREVLDNELVTRSDEFQAAFASRQRKATQVSRHVQHGRMTAEAAEPFIEEVRQWSSVQDFIPGLSIESTYPKPVSTSEVQASSETLVSTDPRFAFMERLLDKEQQYVDQSNNSDVRSFENKMYSYELIALHIYKNLKRGVFEPGQKLTEREFTEEIFQGTSRNTVREGLVLLTGLGFISYERNKGWTFSWPENNNDTTVDPRTQFLESLVKKSEQVGVNALGKMTGISNYELAAAYIYKDVKAGKFKAGETIRESTLAEVFGISRNSLRAAFMLLYGTGIVEFDRHSIKFTEASHIERTSA